jgi:hypothetical protein
MELNNEGACGKRAAADMADAADETEETDETDETGAGGAGMLEHLLVVQARIAKKVREKMEAAGYRFVNVTSRAGDPRKLGGKTGSQYVKLSPFFPVGGVPLPPGVVCGRKDSESVEGLWQGLKIIGCETDFRKFGIKTMKNLKRPARNDTVGGHFVGKDKQPLDYLAARREIYVPAYVLHLKKMRDVVEKLRAEATQHKVALVDYTDAEWDDLSKPLSHACVLRHVLLGRDPLKQR